MSEFDKTDVQQWKDRVYRRKGLLMTLGYRARPLLNEGARSKVPHSPNASHIQESFQANLGFGGQSMARRAPFSIRSCQSC